AAACAPSGDSCATATADMAVSANICLMGNLSICAFQPASADSGQSFAPSLTSRVKVRPGNQEVVGCGVDAPRGLGPGGSGTLRALLPCGGGLQRQLSRS